LPRWCGSSGPAAPGALCPTVSAPGKMCTAAIIAGARLACRRASCRPSTVRTLRLRSSAHRTTPKCRCSTRACYALFCHRSDDHETCDALKQMMALPKAMGGRLTSRRTPIRVRGCTVGSVRIRNASGLRRASARGGPCLLSPTRPVAAHTRRPTAPGTGGADRLRRPSRSDVGGSESGRAARRRRGRSGPPLRKSRSRAWDSSVV